MSLGRISTYSAADEAEWDALVADAPMATFLHTRRFLSHHGDRFSDQSLMLRDTRSDLVGVFPAATDPADDSRVVSHPGITYGGVVHTGSLGGPEMVEALTAICAHYAGKGFRALRYKAVPTIYHRRPSADDAYALWRLAGQLYRCDLSCGIDLSDRPRPSDRRRRGARKASEQGLLVEPGTERLEEFWKVLEENLAARHGVQPTHSVGEMSLLMSLFPDSIELVTGRLAEGVVAGVVLFMTPRVAHAQYIAATEAGRAASALDAVLEQCISRAAASGARFFDFGISTEAGGRVLNAGLHRFKSEFGGGGVAHLSWDLGLGDGDADQPQG